MAVNLHKNNVMCLVTTTPPASKTILVVEDEEAARKLICLILRQGGYNVLEAADSEAATRIHDSHEHQVDLLLTDISLPGSDGCELAAALVKGTPELQVMFMSGLPPEMHELSGLPKFGRHFLQKPFGMAQLLTGVQHFLPVAEPAPA